MVKLMQAPVIVVIKLAFWVIKCFVSSMVVFGCILSPSNNCRAASVDTRYAITPTTPAMARHICKSRVTNYCIKDFISSIKPFPKRQILESSKLKEFADNNFRFDKNGSKFSKQVENTVGKGEIARKEQFLLFPQCFQISCTVDT